MSRYIQTANRILQRTIQFFRSTEKDSSRHEHPELILCSMAPFCAEWIRVEHEEEHHNPTH